MPDTDTSSSIPSALSEVVADIPKAAINPSMNSTAAAPTSSGLATRERLVPRRWGRRRCRLRRRVVIGGGRCRHIRRRLATLARPRALRPGLALRAPPALGLWPHLGGTYPRAHSGFASQPAEQSRPRRLEDLELCFVGSYAELVEGSFLRLVDGLPDRLDPLHANFSCHQWFSRQRRFLPLLGRFDDPREVGRPRAALDVGVGRCFGGVVRFDAVPPEG